MFDPKSVLRGKLRFNDHTDMRHKKNKNESIVPVLPSIQLANGPQTVIPYEVPYKHLQNN
jgi:hypothetical protein